MDHYIKKDSFAVIDVNASFFKRMIYKLKSELDMKDPEQRDLIENKENILHALDGYIENLIAFRTKIQRADKSGLEDEMNQINKIRDILDMGK